MIIQYMSDLHIEFPSNKRYFFEKGIKPQSNILILAGDILPLKLIKKHDDFFSFLSDNFEKTYWLTGNHEYYHSDAFDYFILNEKIKENVILINNNSVQINNSNLIFSTLWTEINNIYQSQIQNGMSDFKLIKFNKQKFSIDNYNNLHSQCLNFLNNELSKYINSIVVTHHVPTFKNYPEKYKGSILNQAFAVELKNLIIETKPYAWIYGHSHYNTKEFIIGDTKLLTNQLGYIDFNEHFDFNSYLTLSI